MPPPPPRGTPRTYPLQVRLNGSVIGTVTLRIERGGRYELDPTDTLQPLTADGRTRLSREAVRQTIEEWIEGHNEWARRCAMIATPPPPPNPGDRIVMEGALQLEGGEYRMFDDGESVVVGSGSGGVGRLLFYGIAPDAAAIESLGAGQWQIRPLQGTVRINGREIRAAWPLEDGDRLEIDGQRFLFELQWGTFQTTAPAQPARPANVPLRADGPREMAADFDGIKGEIGPKEPGSGKSGPKGGGSGGGVPPIGMAPGPAGIFMGWLAWRGPEGQQVIARAAEAIRRGASRVTEAIRSILPGRGEATEAAEAPQESTPAVPIDELIGGRDLRYLRSLTREEAMSDDDRHAARKQRRLKEALESRDPVAVLRALGSLPDIRLMIPTRAPHPGEDPAEIQLRSGSHRRDPRFQKILRSLLEEIRLRIAAGQIGNISGRALSQQARRAGLGSTRAKTREDSAPRRPRRKPVSQPEPKVKARRRPPAPPPTPAIPFPKAKKFFDTHYAGLDFYREDDPVEMLNFLVYPDWMRERSELAGGKKDPVRLAGYEEAVRELYAEAKRLKASGEVKDWKVGSLPLDGVPDIEAPEILRRELRRLIAEDRSGRAIDELVERWRHNGGVRLPAIPSSARGTIHFVYGADVEGGRAEVTRVPADTRITFQAPGGAEDPGRGYWRYAGDSFSSEDRGGRLGRFYFAVRKEHADDFWQALQLNLDLARTKGKRCQAKISLEPTRYQSGDAAVLYFRHEDQESFYRRAVEMASRHPDWFHSSERRPVFAARILREDGIPVQGLSFGQDSPIEHDSFNGRRAEALGKAIRHERLLRIVGERITEEDRIRLMAFELYHRGVNLVFPAFNTGGRSQPEGIDWFRFILNHSDQGPHPAQPHR